MKKDCAYDHGVYDILHEGKKIAMSAVTEKNVHVVRAGVDDGGPHKAAHSMFTKDHPHNRPAKVK